MLLHHYYTSESRCDKNFEIEVKLMESKKNINGMDYVLAGDYYIPDLSFPMRNALSENMGGCTWSI